MHYQRWRANGDPYLVKPKHFQRGNAYGVGHGAITHGLRSSPLYNTWSQMWQRCTNPNHTAFSNYGGRGILICARWRSFENFFADMGERPEGMTLDRIDNDKGYEPGNCRWATQSEQRRNQRKHAKNRG